MADVRFDGLFREEELLPDLAIDETVRDELKHFALPCRGLLLELPHRRVRERDDSGARTTGATTRRSRLESTTVIAVAVEDLLALGCVHALGIGAGPIRL
jgi:hypothetical protein